MDKDCLHRKKINISCWEIRIACIEKMDSSTMNICRVIKTLKCILKLQSSMYNLVKYLTIDSLVEVQVSRLFLIRVLESGILYTKLIEDAKFILKESQNLIDGIVWNSTSSFIKRCEIIAAISIASKQSIIIGDLKNFFKETEKLYILHQKDIILYNLETIKARDAMIAAKKKRTIMINHIKVDLHIISIKLDYVMENICREYIIDIESSLLELKVNDEIIKKINKVKDIIYYSNLRYESRYIQNKIDDDIEYEKEKQLFYSKLLKPNDIFTQNIHKRKKKSKKNISLNIINQCDFDFTKKEIDDNIKNEQSDSCPDYYAAPDYLELDYFESDYSESEYSESDYYGERSDSEDSIVPFLTKSIENDNILYTTYSHDYSSDSEDDEKYIINYPLYKKDFRHDDYFYTNFKCVICGFSKYLNMCICEKNILNYIKRETYKTETKYRRTMLVFFRRTIRMRSWKGIYSIIDNKKIVEHLKTYFYTPHIISMDDINILNRKGRTVRQIAYMIRVIETKNIYNIWRRIFRPWAKLLYI